VSACRYVCVCARLFGRVCVRVYVCECACVCVCVLARACARLRVCVCARMCVHARMSGTSWYVTEIFQTQTNMSDPRRCQREVVALLGFPSPRNVVRERGRGAWWIPVNIL